MNNNNYISEYPEVFFTKSFENNTPSTCECSKCQNCNSSAPPPNNLLSALLPMLSGSGGFNFSSLIKNINPQFSNIFSSLGLTKNNTNKTDKQSKSSSLKKPTIIDISNYTEVE